MIYFPNMTGIKCSKLREIWRRAIEHFSLVFQMKLFKEQRIYCRRLIWLISIKTFYFVTLESWNREDENLSEINLKFDKISLNVLGDNLLIHFHIRIHSRNDRFHRFWYGKVEKVHQSSSTFMGMEGDGMAKKIDFFQTPFPSPENISDVSRPQKNQLENAQIHTCTQSGQWTQKCPKK